MNEKELESIRSAIRYYEKKLEYCYGYVGALNQLSETPISIKKEYYLSLQDEYSQQIDYLLKKAVDVAAAGVERTSKEAIELYVPSKVVTVSKEAIELSRLPVEEVEKIIDDKINSNAKRLKEAAEVEEKPIREMLAKLEHEQWVCWSKDIAKTESINDQRLAKWTSLWREYSLLTEEEKDLDREWADKVIKLLSKAGVGVTTEAHNLDDEV